MPVSLPAHEAAPLFNELVSLPWSESARIQQIEVRLRRLFQMKPDLLTCLGLSKARTMLGLREEADQLVPWLLKATVNADAILALNIVSVACDFGYFDEVMDLADGRPELSHQGMIAAFLSGNIEKLERFSKHLDHQQMLHWLDKLATANLTSLFCDIQTMTREMMAGKFTACVVSLSPVDEDASGRYFTWLDKARRRQLECGIDTMVQSLAEMHGSSWSEMPLVTLVLPLGAHPGSNL